MAISEPPRHTRHIRTVHAVHSLHSPHVVQPAPVTQPLAWHGSAARDLMTRDLGSISERMAHVDAAVRAGVLNRTEALWMRRLIRYARLPDPLAEVDIYQRFSSDPRRQPGEWVVWTHDGERSVSWWMRLVHEVTQPKRPNNGR